MCVGEEVKRLFTIDGDTVIVSQIYDPLIKEYINDYPNFIETPRITPTGKPWVNVTRDDCPYADETYGDCGSCKYFRSSHPGDLIGVCENKKLLVEREENK